MPYTPGPFSEEHLYLQWGGKLPGDEEWSCGLRLAPRNTGPWVAGDASGMIAAAKTAIQSFHALAGTQISPNAKLSFVKLNMIDVDGAYVLKTTNEVVVADVAGGGMSYAGPNQVALAVTMETGFSRGPAHRGRFYLPMPGIAVAADGLIASADALNVKSSCTTLLTNLNAISTKYGVAVLSRKAGAATSRMVTGFTVGRALDTQRRRRRSLLETRV